MTNQNYVMDMDVCSMYAWSPLIVKQSLICKILKQVRSGKSHRAKILAKRRLRLYKGAWIEYDTDHNKEWTKKNISKIDLGPAWATLDPLTYQFDKSFKSVKERMNKNYGQLA